MVFIIGPCFACVLIEVALSKKISVPSIIFVVGYFSKLFGKYFLTNFCEGKGKYNGNSWYKKFIHVVNVFEIRGTDTSKHTRFKPNENKNSSNNESFLLRPGLLTFLFWYFNVPSLNLSAPYQKCIVLAFGSKYLNTAFSAS